ncbi:MAG: hypothetical protein PVJ28_00170 [Acidimicrobiia bacterium]|jgi:hypothetical protein
MASVPTLVVPVKVKVDMMCSSLKSIRVSRDVWDRLRATADSPENPFFERGHYRPYKGVAIVVDPDAEPLTFEPVWDADTGAALAMLDALDHEING